jgi:hypothetical protein
MKTRSPKLQRIMMASALASGLISAGVQTSARTTTAPATAMNTNATNVSMSKVDSKNKRQDELEQANAETRRMLFRNQNTSL